MKNPIFRVTSKGGEWLANALVQAEHLFVKSKNGQIFCRKHNRDASLCRERQGSNLVYESGLDGGAYLLQVTRVAPYSGRLTLTRNDGVIFEANVGIMYDAPYGPDAEDVQLWQDMGVAAADMDYRSRGEDPPA